MPEAWTGELVGKMHMHRVSNQDLANEMFCCKSYVGRILNGQRNPKGARERLEAAFERVLEKRKEDG